MKGSIQPQRYARMISQSWKEVKSATIQQCFRGAGWKEPQIMRKLGIVSPLSKCHSTPENNRIIFQKTNPSTPRNPETIIESIQQNMQTLLHQENVEVVLEDPSEDYFAVQPFQLHQNEIAKSALGLSPEMTESPPLKTAIPSDRHKLPSFRGSNLFLKNNKEALSLDRTVNVLKAEAQRMNPSLRVGIFNTMLDQIVKSLKNKNEIYSAYTRFLSSES